MTLNRRSQHQFEGQLGMKSAVLEADPPEPPRDAVDRLIEGAVAGPPAEEDQGGVIRVPSREELIDRD
jgi:hypothetical protein